MSNTTTGIYDDHASKQIKPHEALATFGKAAQAAQKFICIHEEFRFDCPKCLRQEIRRLRKKAGK